VGRSVCDVKRNNNNSNNNNNNNNKVQLFFHPVSGVVNDFVKEFGFMFF
jgi:hypothetical protein